MTERFGSFAFHRERRQLFRDGAEVHLTPKAFDLLALLIEREPAVVSKAEVHARLWPGTFVSDATLAGLIKELRRALGDGGAGVVIRIAHRVGFAFEGVRTASPAVRSAPDLTHWLAVGTQKIPLQEGPNVSVAIRTREYGWTSPVSLVVTRRFS